MGSAAREPQQRLPYRLHMYYLIVSFELIPIFRLCRGRRTGMAAGAPATQSSRVSYDGTSNPERWACRTCPTFQVPNAAMPLAHFPTRRNVWQRCGLFRRFLRFWRWENTNTRRLRKV